MGQTRVSQREPSAPVLLFATLPLAAWRVARTWRLLALACVGMVAAVALVCAAPLFSFVAQSAGIRTAVSGPPSNREINVMAQTATPSVTFAQTYGHQIAGILRHHLDATVALGAPTFSIISPAYTLLVNTSPTDVESGQSSMGSLSLYGTEQATSTSQFAVVTGRLPRDSADLEIALTQPTADALHLTVGSRLELGSPVGTAPIAHPVSVQVVGILQTLNPRDAQLFDPALQTETPDSGQSYTAIASSTALLRAASSADTSLTSSAGLWNLWWGFPLDISRLDIQNLDRVVDQMDTLTFDLFTTLRTDTPSANPLLQSQAITSLHTYREQVRLLAIPLSILLVQLFGLVLVFVHVLAAIVVDQQTPMIATMRGRGASMGQVVAVFASQGVAMGLVAILLGPPLAVIVARVVAGRVLPQASQDALALLSGDSIPVAPVLGLLALGAALAMAFAWYLAARRAATLNVLTQRQEATRSRRVPLWQRLYLDLIAIVLAVAGYAELTLTTQATSTQPQPIVTPLALALPLCVLVAGALLFLRAFPWLLRLAAHMAAHSRRAYASLAFTQMARATHQAARMILLLALTTAFALFTLCVLATQAQRIQDVAAFQAGADFSGGLAPQGQGQFVGGGGAAAMDELEAAYRSVPGVRAASLGYRTATLVGGSSNIVAVDSAGNALDTPSVQIIAVDTATFGQTALWTREDSAQSLAALLTRMATTQSDAATQDAVPAVVDTATWDMLHLHPGMVFSLGVPGSTSQGMRFSAVAMARHIPSVFDGQDGVGILVDYSRYGAVYAHDTGHAPPSPNFAWLRTSDDARSLASVRHAISIGPLQLSALPLIGTTLAVSDRRAMIENYESNPLRINLVGMLGIGATTALILALVGTIVAAAVYARAKIMTYALLRALGTESRHIFLCLLWEQGTIYAIAISLGIVLAIFLTVIVLPAIPSMVAANAFGAVISPTAPALRIVVPLQVMVLALGLLIAICSIALAITAHMVARASLSQTLRLNED